jgi:site-specific recombinase XerD
MLISHKAEQDTRAALIGSAWTDNGLVCPNQSGGIMNRTQPYIAVKSLVNAHKELPQELHPHSLRHSFVSMLISQGVDVVHVASLAGDTVEVISKIYAHAFKEREAAAMEQIGAAFAQVSATTPKLITAPIQ